ncbi:MAG: serine/threonine-protein kinase, partial [Gemmatimonadaceae bacterium]
MTDIPEGLATALADRYRIERELGRGAMATVFLAEDLKHHRRVAIKVLRHELAAILGADRFLREITITAQLDHPHILPLLDSGAVDQGTAPSLHREGFLYYVMPYVEGESLRDRLTREKQLPLHDALRIAVEVADALGYAHSRGIIHRDIKPENILLSGPHARVADFGIARALTAAGGETLTQAGLPLGTPAYMSPEQHAAEKDIDGRADLYALGCTLYELLAGQPPFAGATVESMSRQHMLTQPPSIVDLRPSVPADVADALRRTLAKNPADRFSTAGELAEALTRSSGLRAGPKAPARARHRSRLWFAAPAIVLGVVIAVFATMRVRGSVPHAASTMAVMPFLPVVSDTALSRLGRELVITISATLDGVGGIQTADAMTVLAQTGDRAAALTLEQAAALGRRLNSRSIAFGSLVRTGKDVKLDVGIFNTGDLRSIARASVTASPNDITAFTDSASLTLVRQLWRSGDAPSPSLAAVTTPSVEALRAFLEG